MITGTWGFIQLWKPAPFPMPELDTVVMKAVYDLGSRPPLFGRYTMWVGAKRDDIQSQLKQENIDISGIMLHRTLERLADQGFITREYRTDAKKGYMPKGWVTAYFDDAIEEMPTYFDTTCSGLLPEIEEP